MSLQQPAPQAAEHLSQQEAGQVSLQQHAPQAAGHLSQQEAGQVSLQQAPQAGQVSQWPLKLLPGQ